MTLNTLRQAVERKASITFEYNKVGKIVGERIGNPHAVFIMRKKDGTESTKVHIYQTAGVSDSAQVLPDFRMFDLSELSNVNIVDGQPPFQISEKYNPEWSGYSFTIAKV
ncbi:hypothetical protein AB4252_07340 [Vibrio cyclitrophicus]